MEQWYVQNIYSGKYVIETLNILSKHISNENIKIVDSKIYYYHTEKIIINL